MDLLFWHPTEGLVLVEVKSNKAEWSLQDRVKVAQLKDIQRVRIATEHMLQHPVVVKLAMVSSREVMSHNLEDWMF